MRPAALLLTLAVLAAAPRASAQLPVDTALSTYIASIRAIDSHAHPMRSVPPSAPADTEYDALPLDGIPPFTLPWRLRLENPEWRAAQRAMSGVTYNEMRSDTGAAHDSAIVRGVARIAREQGAHYPTWVLDRIGTQIMLANRVAMGPGLDSPRFRWVAFDDALMLPLDTRVEGARTPDTRPLYPREAALLRRYLHDLGRTGIPRTLDAYVRQVVTPTLERQRRGGAVSIKFETAYLRPLDFADPDTAAARRIYARYATGGTPTHAEYKTLEDNGPTQSWGMVAWFGAHSAREALGAALTGMMRDGEIDRARAEELARMVLRENAIRAYRLDVH